MGAGAVYMSRDGSPCVGPTTAGGRMGLPLLDGVALREPGLVDANSSPCPVGPTRTVHAHVALIS